MLRFSFTTLTKGGFPFGLPLLSADGTLLEVGRVRAAPHGARPTLSLTKFAGFGSSSSPGWWPGPECPFTFFLAEGSPKTDYITNRVLRSRTLGTGEFELLLVPGVSTLQTWVHDPFILGNEPIFSGSWGLVVDTKWDGV